MIDVGRPAWGRMLFGVLSELKQIPGCENRKIKRKIPGGSYVEI